MIIRKTFLNGMRNCRSRQHIPSEHCSLIKYLPTQALDCQQIEDLFTVCKDLLQQWSSKALEEWLIVFEDILKSVQFASIKKECSSLVILLSEISQPLESKICAARIYSYLSYVIPDKEYESLFLPSIRNLCHDFNWQVRKTMCDSMSQIIKQYKDADCGKELFSEEVLDLATDYEEDVRCSCLVSFLNVFGYVMQQYSSQICTVIKGIFTKMTEKVALCIVERIGLFFMGVL